MIIERKLNYTALLTGIISLALTETALNVAPYKNARTEGAHHSANTAEDLLIASMAFMYLTILLMLASAVLRAKRAYDDETENKAAPAFLAINAILFMLATPFAIFALEGLQQNDHGSDESIVHGLKDAAFYDAASAMLIIGLIAIIGLVALTFMSRSDDSQLDKASVSTPR